MSRTPPTPKPAPRRMVSLDKAAEYADVGSRTMRRYIATGIVTGYRVGPRMIRVDLEEVDRVLLTPIPTAGGM